MSDNFFSFLFGQNGNNSNGEKVAEDKAPKEKALTGGYFVFCKDSEGTLKDLIEAIGKHGNSGHSYDIVLDPDYEKEKETFFWDGDGSDRINSIIAIPNGEGMDNPLVKMCLQMLNSIKMQAEEAVREDEEYGEPPPTSEEKKHILNDIIHDSDIILRGANYTDHHLGALQTIKARCENLLDGLKDGSLKDLSAQEMIEHIKKIAEEGLEKGITFLS